jgi:hypothetical protein
MVFLYILMLNGSFEGAKDFRMPGLGSASAKAT